MLMQEKKVFFPKYRERMTLTQFFAFLVSFLVGEWGEQARDVRRDVHVD